MQADPKHTDRSQELLEEHALAALADDLEAVDGVWLYTDVEVTSCGAAGCHRGTPVARIMIAGFGIRTVCLWHAVDLLSRETNAFSVIERSQRGVRC